MCLDSVSGTVLSLISLSLSLVSLSFLSLFSHLQGYQHLFYQLQTNPIYLARLIFQMPPGRTTRFMENVILTLFNFASNPREEYLLMKLFVTAMDLELK